MTILEQVYQDGMFLKYVEEQTPELCMVAVNDSGMALQYVKEQTPEICLAAVMKNGYALKYVKEQTDEICKIAVKQDGMILRYVKEQTPELCLAAVKQDGLALEFVKDKTTEICMAAIKQMSKNKLQRFVLWLSHIDQTPENNMAAVAAVREMLNGRRPKFTWQLLKIMDFLSYLLVCMVCVPNNKFLNSETAVCLQYLTEIHRE